MSSRIKLFWYRHKEGKGNFGDELNPYIIGKLSGLGVDFIDVKYLNDNKLLILKILIIAFVKFELSIFTLIRYIAYNFIIKPKVLLAIGSVLQMNRYGKTIVWGSGIISDNIYFPNANFLAVRGKYTQNEILNLGYKSPDVIGDPAILLPLLYKPTSQKKYKFGIIPHYVHYEEIKSRSNDEVLVINLLNEIESVLEQIYSCEVIFSTSLHGLIVSHAYGIPALWVEFGETKHKLTGDNVKFYDYFSSVDIQEYCSYFITNDYINYDYLLKGIDNQLLMPNMAMILNLQKGLLKVAPFEIKKEYKL